MFRKPVKKRTVQTRNRDNNSSGDEAATDIIKDAVIKRKRRDNPMRQSTKKRTADEDCASTSSGSDEEAVVAEHAFAATGSAAPSGPKDQGATATLDIDTDYAADAQAQFERVQKQLKEGLEKDGKVLYKGQAMYGAKEAKDTAKGNASSGLNRMGPVRAPQFLRQTVRWDFAPDICKDYKETGFCTFGDSCKFLHDRSDYKHGWEIERDHASGRLNQVDDTNYEITEDDDGFPEECFVCGNEFVEPVVTRCKHYFCQQCALSSFRKSKKCPVCNQSTGGVFNIARDLVLKLSGKKKSRGEEIKEESDDSGDEIKEEVEDGDTLDAHSHEHGESCAHSHVKLEQPEEDENQNSDEPVNDVEIQEEVDIKMEEIESDGEEEDDHSDEEDDDEEEKEEK